MMELETLLYIQTTKIIWKVLHNCTMEFIYGDLF